MRTICEIYCNDNRLVHNSTLKTKLEPQPEACNHFVIVVAVVVSVVVVVLVAAAPIDAHLC